MAGPITRVMRKVLMARNSDVALGGGNLVIMRTTYALEGLSLVK